MKTIYYFAQTEADNFVLATDGRNCYPCAVNSNGADASTGIDLYRTDADGRPDVRHITAELAKAYAAIDGLYSMADITRDFPDAVVPFDADRYGALEKIIEI